MVCMNTLHSVVTAGLIGLCVCVGSSGFICSVFPLQMEALQAQEPIIGLLSLSQWAVVNLKPADSRADIGRLSMNNCTARATLSLSVWKKNRQGFTSYSAVTAVDDYHKLVTERMLPSKCATNPFFVFAKNATLVTILWPDLYHTSVHTFHPPPY